MESTKYKLTGRDWLKGLLMAVGTAFFTTLTASLNSGALPTLPQLKACSIAGIIAGLFYVGKNFMTNDVPAAIKTLDKAAPEQLTKNQ